MDTTLALVANLNQDDIKLAIKQYVERQTNMEVVEVTTSASVTEDYYGHPTGGYSIKASASLKKKDPHSLGTDH